MVGMKFKGPKSIRKVMRQLRRADGQVLPQHAEQQLLQQLQRERHRLTHQGHWRDALPPRVYELTVQCLELAEKIYTSDSPEFVQELELLALCHIAQGEDNALVDTLEKRLPILKKHCCPHVYLKKLDWLVKACCQTDRRDEAERVFSEGLLVRQHLYGLHSSEYKHFFDLYSGLMSLWDERGHVGDFLKAIPHG